MLYIFITNLEQECIEHAAEKEHSGQWLNHGNSGERVREQSFVHQ